MSYNNGLTPAQEERLNLLIEEASEVIQMATKILRFGYHSSHVNYGNVPNKALLEKEVGDLLCAVSLAVANDDMNQYSLNNNQNDKNRRMREFLFYQTVFPEMVN